MTDGEEWRPVPLAGYSENYSVSSAGRVKSRPRRRTRGGVLSQRVNRRGYLQVMLACNGRQQRFDVHRLVALAFIGPRPDEQEVRHLDGNRENPNLGNLVYGSRSENVRDALEHGTHNQASKTHCPKGHEYNDENTYVIPSRPTARYCRPCNLARSRAFYEASKRR